MAKSKGPKLIETSNTVHVKAMHVITFVKDGRRIYGPSYNTLLLNRTVLKVEQELVNGKQKTTYVLDMFLHSQCWQATILYLKEAHFNGI